jgi:MFS family permease
LDTALPRERWKMLGVVSVAQFLGMTLWFSATAITPRLIDEYQIAPTHAAWLTMAVQAGFVAGTLLTAVSNVADVLNARVLMFAGSIAGALTNAAVLMAPGGGSVIALRFLTGASLALVYPPGMKIAAAWFREGRGLALGILLGA